ncbi:MAG TPA: phosphatidylserine decarboxylase [Candidatus Cryosericum sp.]|nr:phosphatidylserine decarboxylase [Candidatus Cryosericum sp.]
MAKKLTEWIESDVQPLRDLPVSELSQLHFFRDPCRPACSDTAYFFAPADGVILYQETVDPGDPIVDVKGRPYSLREALRDPGYDERSLVIGIFMTFYDVHVNRIPFAGRLSYRLVDPIDTYNRPMLEIERCLVEDLKVSLEAADYLHVNQRMVNRVDAPDLGQSYYILQVADYDVDSITPFDLKQNQPHDQGHRFSQIRYGSQVDLIVPLSPRFEFLPTQSVGWHVEAGLDTLVAIKERAGATR